MLMDAVAGEKNRRRLEAIGDQLATSPAPRRDDLVGNVLAETARDDIADEFVARLVAIVLAMDADAPELVAVDLDQAAVIAAFVDEEIERGFAFIVLVPQLFDL